MAGAVNPQFFFKKNIIIIIMYIFRKIKNICLYLKKKSIFDPVNTNPIFVLLLKSLTVPLR
jgi:hypothetical protein